jgi:HlyD family secretion protein
MRRLVLLLLVPLAVSCGESDQRWQGYAEGEYLRLGAPQAGWIESVEVERGAQVMAGTRLFTLESEQQRAAVREAEGRLATAEAQLADLKLGRRPEEIAQIEANLSEAKAGLSYAEQDLRRQRMLARADVAAQARLDLARSAALEAQARVAAMEAQLAAARLPARTDQIVAAEATVASARAALAQAAWLLDQRTIRAPADALVEDTVRKAGEWVSAGGTVISLLPAGNVKVRFFVPEPALPAVRTGQRVVLHCGRLSGGHHRHHPLRGAAGRIHATGHLQRRQPGKAGVHGRSLARRRCPAASRPAGGRRSRCSRRVPAGGGQLRSEPWSWSWHCRSST